MSNSAVSDSSLIPFQKTAPKGDKEDDAHFGRFECKFILVNIWAFI